MALNQADITRPAVTNEQDVARPVTAPPPAKYGVARFGQSSYGSQGGGNDVARPAVNNESDISRPA